MKKANKGREGQTKARESTISKFYHFFMLMGLLGVTNSHVSLFLSFKAKKVKKAALVAKNTKLQTGKLIGSKILSYHLVRCFNVPFVQIWTPYSKRGILKAKMYLKGRKIQEYQKNL